MLLHMDHIQYDDQIKDAVDRLHGASLNSCIDISLGNIRQVPLICCLLLMIALFFIYSMRLLVSASVF